MVFRRIICALCVSVAVPATADSGSEQASWLKAHNDARAEFGSEPLAWSPALEQQAREYAARLARKERLRHSERRDREGQGENLWMGTKHRFSAARMIDAFVDEKRYFKEGRFPQISTTGNWGDVGHYTQIVWHDTREVGCAKAEGRHFDVLVCRYYPAGNVIGTYLAPRPRMTSRQLPAN